MSEQARAVLIVEDDEKLHDLIRRMVEPHCSLIDVATDGERAVELLQQKRYDYVILDLMLPKKNGFIVAEAAASLPNAPKLIVLSAISRYFHDRFPPGTEIFQKPFEIEKIAGAVSGARV